MVKLNIAIPTCKTEAELIPLLREIRETASTNIHELRLIHTCYPGSAAKNRNIALDKTGEFEPIIMLDDDITGFRRGWDEELIRPLFNNGLGTHSNVALVSARLMNVKGMPAHMMGENYDMTKPIVEVDVKRLPTACIAFLKHPLIRFDEQFIGSGFEDDDFCKQLQNLYPDGRFVINNGVVVVHKNEMKNQKTGFWYYNKAYYLRKWTDETSRWDGDR
jgi:hypothetical protein